ncbi:MAG: MBOAT family protein [Elusimicrobiota bacterium]|jgi:D-alanyl-lipoteichoic acid acyltransferase DltB (MBOAT superfamily)|nr:MBOAT family protein [Elusimicrobiota bacterium]
MLFNSFNFLLFFPFVTILYFAIPHRFRYFWLLIASYFFYMSWNPKYALLLASSTIITYLSGILIDFSNKNSNENKRNFQRKLWVFLSFSSNLSILFFFKYFDFAISNINFVFAHIGIKLLNPSFDILLPIGISFYTFQALSYTMDIYRGEIAAEKNIAKYALFVSFFPQLVAGPIERSKNLLNQMTERHYFDYDRVKNGLLLMLWGYFEKLVIADRLALIVNEVFANTDKYTGFQIAVPMILFAFQIYCDFAGYSNISRGAGQVMGFKLMENFRQPYFAVSIQDFWRRWHISLSAWFRDYLYIPLGGNRRSKARKYINVFITFVISGLWHGAAWNFFIWGALHGTYQIIGQITKPFKDKICQTFKINQNTKLYQAGKIIMTFILVDFAWLFFRAQDGEFITIIKKLFAKFNYAVLFHGRLVGKEFKDDLYLGIFFIVILMIINGFQNKNPNKPIREIIARQNIFVRWTFYYGAIFIILIFGIYDQAYKARDFIYFQF